MAETLTSRGTIVENKAIIKSGTFDIVDIINESDEIKGEIEAICRYKGVQAVDYIARLPEVSQAIKGILKDTEISLTREIEKLYPVTNDRTDPEIKSVRVFGDLVLEYIVSVFHERIIDYSEAGQEITTTDEGYTTPEVVEPIQLTDQVVSI